ncbi:MAG: radical SAM protein [Thermoleophilia bacterium]
MGRLKHNSLIAAGIISRRVLTGPHSVQISIVDACNYRCVMCWEHSSELDGLGADDLARNYHDQRKNGDMVMDFALYESLVRSLSSMGTREISFAGIGEPLLHKRIVEAVALAKSLGLRVWITTNGSLLDRAIIKELADAGVDDIGVSINAGSSEEYGLVHANQEAGRFDEIVENLAWLREYKRSRGNAGPRVTLSNVVSNLNSHRVVEMMQTAVKVGAVSVTYRPIDVFDKTRKFALGKNEMDKLAGDFRAAADLGKRNNIGENIKFFYGLLEMRKAENLPSPCFAGWLYPFVLANGDVTYCCISRELLGNLSQRSFESIWFDPARRRLNKEAARLHKTQTPLPKSRCVGCELTLSNQRIYNRLWPLWGRPALPRG